MRLLLDTHTFLWAASDPAALGRRARALILDPDNDRVLSVASIWELAIKVGLGKLRIATPLSEMVAHQEAEAALEILDVRREHVLGVQTLPPHHRDPFDRLLVAQCRIEQLDLVSADSALDKYGIRRIW
jgi:PIN domain nuclease of toxin-antitoxin system